MHSFSVELNNGILVNSFYGDKNNTIEKFFRFKNIFWTNDKKNIIFFDISNNINILYP